MNSYSNQKNAQLHRAKSAPIMLLLLTGLALVMVRAGSSSAHAGLSTSESSNIAAAPMSAGRIAFTGFRDGQTRSDIYAMNPDGSNVVRLTTDPGIDQFPDWSPDGSKIVFSSSRDHTNNAGEIYVMNADGSNQHIIATGLLPNQEPSWSPDGSKIVFSAFAVGSPWPDIYVMNADGSGVSRLTVTTDGVYPDAPAWSPDGTMIAYDMPDRVAGGTTRSLGGTHSIYVMTATGGNQHAITSGHADYQPDWSPDGSKIAFARLDTSRSQFDLWKMNSGGGGETLVTSGGASLPLGATWSPDGTMIAFHVLDGSIHMFVVNADGTNKHDISGNATSDSNADWGDVSATTILVQDEQGTPVAEAEVYTTTLSPASPASFVGTTNVSGTLSLPNPQVDDYVIARTLVYTGTTSKPGHDQWAYHVWLTDIDQQTDGSQDAYIITDTNKLTQTVTLKRENAQIGLNVVGSFNYNASTEALESVRDGMQSASEYLFDVTDGQMFYENFALHEDNASFQDADIQFEPSVWPKADANGPSGVTSTRDHLYMPGPGFDGNKYWGGWVQSNAYRTFVHEFGHYAFGALDEYQKIQAGIEVTSTCTLDPQALPEESRASIMNFQYNSTELCGDSDHNSDTDQGQTLNESVWATFVRNWSDYADPDRWLLRSPMTRSNFTDPGPFDLPYMDQMNSTIEETSPQACYAIPAKIQIRVGGVTYVYPGLSTFLQHNGRTIDEGPTDRFGLVNVYGVVVGDRITVSTDYGGTRYTGSYQVSDCSDTPTIDLIPVPPSRSEGSKPAAMLPTAFSRYWLTSTLNYAQNRLDLTLHFDGETTSPPTLSVSQDGAPGAQVALTYDPSSFAYNGAYIVNPAYGLNFAVEVQVPSGSQSIVSSFHIVGTHFSASGPSLSRSVAQMAQRPAVPTGWSLFPSENMVTLSVNSSSLPDDTGIVSGQTDLPAPPPTGTLAVGGPYYVQGDRPIMGQVGVALSYQADLFCGLQPGSASIYRYNGSGWTAIATTLNSGWNRAYANLDQWGIYAVFAEPNPLLVFSDVPEGSTFYTYINWITCHGVASGYPDGTFRPGNNATRGQISKMVANAFHWYLDPPASGGYTFADVLPGSTFFFYIEAAYREGVVTGYPCGGPGEPCDPSNRPYFHPNNNVTRGQLSKIIANASKWDETPTTQTFEDVPPTQTFYQYIERMATRGIIGGYPCGGPGEPCGQGNKPYFRPGNNASRGQLSKMVYLALFPR